MSAAIKMYFLVEVGALETGARVSAFSDPDDREAATLKAIFGPFGPMKDQEGEAQKYLNELRQEGVVKFGDYPPFLWVESNIELITPRGVPL